MIRKALLIGMPGNPDDFDYLPGVMQDINSVKNYLMSLAGGDWYENEIEIILNKPSYYVINRISALDCNYAYIHFSGHGGYSESDKRTFLYMADGKMIKDWDLYNRNIKRQTIVIDACRTFLESGIEGVSLFESALFSHFDGKASTRNVFDSAVLECETGVVWLYSTDINQGAGEDSEGGYFTQCLLKTGKQWHTNNKGIKALSIRKAASEACVKLSKYPTDQTPMINGGRRIKWFPFSVVNENMIFG